MRFRFFGSLLGLLTLSATYAQKGDGKDQANMSEVVPKEIIPAAPVLTVEEALKTFTLQEGFVIEPVVTEPLIDKPVSITFDARGRMWVCEMRGYMHDIDGTREHEPMGRIAILEDTNGDGKADKRTEFLDKLLLPRSIALVPGGVLVGDQNKLYFIERDGDKPKGELRVVDSKYADGGNVEHKSNGMMPNIDNWMYNAKSAWRYKWRNGKLIKESTNFRGQWGITHDDLGRIFTNSNSTMLTGDRTLPNLLKGNPLVKFKTKISKNVGSNKVYPGRVTPGLNRAYTAKKNGYPSDLLDPKTFKLTNCTAACGPVIYRGTNYPNNFKGWAFICESAAQLVKAVKVNSHNNDLSGSHPLGNHEFITSTDERFRPVNLHNAPDGSLYLVDYYHGIIQHKTYMTTYLRKQTLSRGLEGPGFGHGRIYRIRATSKPLDKVPNLETAKPKELLAVLEGANGALRDLAQKEIIGRSIDPALIREALKKTHATKNIIAQIHLIWSLEGQDMLKADDLKAALASGNDELISTALYAGLSMTDPERSNLALEAASLPAKAMTLPYQARFLASVSNATSQDALAKLLKKHGKMTFVREAAISGLSKNAAIFSSANKGSYSDKEFQKWLGQTAKGPQKKVDPAALLKGEHLASYKRGGILFGGRAACVGCHGANGEGLDNLGPLLDKSDWVTGSQERLVKILLHGLTGPIKINGELFTPVAFMPGLDQNPTITDQDLADIATFIRAGWNNRAPQVTAATVKEIRKANAKRPAGKMFKQEDFPAK